jgi:Putative zinc-finger
MKCDDCFNLLEEYIDGEVIERDAAQVSAHLITCAACAHELEALTAEREVYALYDRELTVSPAMWNAIATRTAESRPVDSGSRFSLGGWLAGLFATPRYAFGGAAAVVIFAVVMGVVFLRTRTPKQAAQPETVAGINNVSRQSPTPDVVAINHPPKEFEPVRSGPYGHPMGEVPGAKLPKNPRRSDQSDVLDAAYTDIEDKDTADHVAQAENLLRSVRNLQTSDDDEEVDVSYEKAESRRLLDENVVLRRDAEMNGKYPVKKLLGELEPFLIDIANLPDKTTPTDLRAIKDRVQKTEIVAALRSY